MTEVLKTSEIYPRSRWSGNAIWKTKDCEGCQYYKDIIDDEQGSNILEKGCVWGVAWKRLEIVSSPRKCGKISKV